MPPKLLSLLLVCLLFAAPSMANKALSPKTNQCRLDDDSYEAYVDYPVTNDSTVTLSLLVEVENCKVTKIYFQRDGYTDKEDVTPADIDAHDVAIITGENGRVYKVTVDEDY